MRVENEVLVGDPRWELVERIASSGGFASSPALRRFLLFVCECTLTGRADDIKEQQIGHRVLGRPADYNPAEDNIVRVRAREVRRRLEEYFAGEGKDEPTVIQLPRGGYVPVFVKREEAAAPQHEAAHPRRDIMPWILVAALALSTAALLVRELARRPTPDISATGRLWSQLVQPGRETLLVVADSNFVLLQDLARNSLTLEDYIGQRYLQRGEFKDANMQLIATRQTTGLGEMNVLARIFRMNPEIAQRMRLRYARDLEVRDLKSGNAVLMGASRSNPWVQLYEPRCNFIFRYDATRALPYIENRAPAPGEAATYQTEIRDNTRISYATIAFLPSLAETGHVLIISGLKTEGTEAAGEFVTLPEACQRLLAKAGVGSAGPIHPFEALIKMTNVGGGSSGSEILAVRRPSH